MKKLDIVAAVLLCVSLPLCAQHIRVEGTVFYDSDADGLVRMSQAINDRTMGCRTVFTIGNHDPLKGNVEYAGDLYCYDLEALGDGSN